MDPGIAPLQSSDDTVRIAASYALNESSMLHPENLADVWVALHCNPAELYENKFVQYGCGFWEVLEAHAYQLPVHADQFATHDVFLAWAASSASGVA